MWQRVLRVAIVLCTAHSRFVARAKDASVDTMEDVAEESGTLSSDGSRAVNTMTYDALAGWYQMNFDENATQLVGYPSDQLTGLRASQTPCTLFPSLQTRSTTFPSNNGCPKFYGNLGASCTCLTGFWTRPDFWEFKVRKKKEMRVLPFTMNYTEVLEIDQIATLWITEKLTRLKITGMSDEPLPIVFVSDNRAYTTTDLPIVKSETINLHTVEISSIDMRDLLVKAANFIPPSVYNLFGMEFIQTMGSLQYVDLRGNKINYDITAAMFETIKNYDEFYADPRNSSVACDNGEWRVAHDVSFCVALDTSTSADDSKGIYTIVLSAVVPGARSLSSGSLIIIVAGGSIVVVLLLFFARRQRKSKSILFKEEDDSMYIKTSDYGDTSGTVSAYTLEDPLLLSHRIPLDDLRVGQCVNRGGFGLVFVGEYQGRKVAVKKIRSDMSSDIEQIELFLKEITLMATLVHPRIVEFIGVAWDSLRHLSAVTEFMERGDLRDVLHGFKTRGCQLTWETHKTHISLHIAEALTYLHSLRPKKVIHRDLKSKNVLMTADLEAKLSDFGISRERRYEDTHMTAGIGTSFWIAPEVLMGKDYDEKADIFSFGVVLSEIDTDDYPYWNEKNPQQGGKLQQNEILRQVALGAIRPEFTEDCPEAILELADRCLQVNPDDRPTGEEILRFDDQAFRCIRTPTRVPVHPLESRKDIIAILFVKHNYRKWYLSPQMTPLPGTHFILFSWSLLSESLHIIAATRTTMLRARWARGARGGDVDGAAVARMRLRMALVVCVLAICLRVLPRTTAQDTATTTSTDDSGSSSNLTYDALAGWYQTNFDENATQLIGLPSDQLAGLRASQTPCTGLPSLQTRSSTFPSNKGCPAFYNSLGASCTCIMGYVIHNETWEFKVRKKTSMKTMPFSMNSTQVFEVDQISTLWVPTTLTRLVLRGVSEEPLPIVFVSDNRAVTTTVLPVAKSSSLILNTLEIYNIDMRDVIMNTAQFVPSTVVNLYVRSISLQLRTLQNVNFNDVSTGFGEAITNVQYLDLSNNKLQHTFIGKKTNVCYLCSVIEANLSNNFISEPLTEDLFAVTTLRKLDLRGNPLDMTVSAANFEKIKNFDAFYADGPNSTAKCDNGTWQKAHNVTFCVGIDATLNAAPSKAKASTDKLIYVAIGGCVVVVLLLFLVVRQRWWKSKHGAFKDEEDSIYVKTSDYDDSHGALNAYLLNDPLIITNRIPWKDLKVGDCINRGGFGLVFVGEYQGRKVAVKKIRSDMSSDIEQIELFLKEISLMATLVHPRIVEFIGAAWDSLRHLSAVTEFMERGDLRSVLQGFKTRGCQLTWETHKTHISLHIAEALTYLHSLRPKKVIHRDLKSKNVLMTADLEAKLSDFGISRERRYEDTHMTAGIGTSFWIAPEVLMGKDYDEKADIFSFGVVLSEIDTDDYPYWNEKNPQQGGKLQQNEILRQVALGAIRPEFTEDCPEAILELADRCLQVNPDDRPTAPEIVYCMQRILRGSVRSLSSSSVST
ncbi:Tkl protein kinase, partial [Globisporangium splendens]